MTWMSKQWKGKAHFLVDGVPACTTKEARDSYPACKGVAAFVFTCTWKERDLNDHLCKVCRSVHHGVCECSLCKAFPSANTHWRNAKAAR